MQQTTVQFGFCATAVQQTAQNVKHYGSKSNSDFAKAKCSGVCLL